MVFFDKSGRKVRPYDAIARALRGIVLFFRNLKSCDGFVCNVAFWSKWYKEPLILIMNLEDLYKVLELYYGWSIESMFRDFKLVHFGVEETGVTYPNRLFFLYLAIVLAYIFFVFIGSLEERKRRKNKKRRRGRRIGVFLLGFRIFVSAVFSNDSCLFSRLVDALASFVSVVHT